MKELVPSTSEMRIASSDDRGLFTALNPTFSPWPGIAMRIPMGMLSLIWCRSLRMAFSDVGLSEQMPMTRAISDADMPVLSSVKRTRRSRTDRILLLDVPLAANPASFNSEISSSVNVLNIAGPP